MNKKFILIISLIVIILGLAFYWFQLRPNQIKKDCSRFLTGLPSRAPSNSGGRLTAIGSNSGEEAYKKCLSENGL